MATSSADIESELKRFGLPQYRLGEFLGSGSYGRVWAAENTSTNPVTKVAVKKIVFGLLSEDPTLRAFNARRVLREVTFLGYFRNHPHIVTLLDIAMSPERNCILAVMEATETDLGKLMANGTPFTMYQLKSMAYQLLFGLLFMHRCNVVHRDLKPGNILVDVSVAGIKICDLGLARCGGVNNPTLNVVTENYRAPEIFMQDTGYTSQIDVWSAGCVLAQLLNRRPRDGGFSYRPLFPGLLAGHPAQSILEQIIAFVGTPSEEDLRNMGTAESHAMIRSFPVYPPADVQRLLVCPDGRPVPPKGVALVQAMLQFNPNSRITVVDAMAHPFLSEHFLADDVNLEIEGEPFVDEFEDDIENQVCDPDDLETVLGYLSRKVEGIQAFLRADAERQQMGITD
eukprot:RCo054691